MTYGTMLVTTRIYVEERAKEANIAFEDLGIDPEWYETEEGHIIPEFVREIAVIYGGALDETFYLDAKYAHEVCNWIADQCRECAVEDDGESWTVILSVPGYEDSETIYKVSSDD
jgi:hypothetical protein